MGQYPQASVYAGLQKSLQQEWQFLQRVTSGLSDELEAVEEALAENFLPSLFGTGIQCDTKRQLACLPVEEAGSCPFPIHGLRRSCVHHVTALWGMTDFWSDDHSSTMQSGKAELRKRNQTVYEEKLVATSLRPMTAEKVGQFAEEKRQAHGSQSSHPSP